MREYILFAQLYSILSFGHPVMVVITTVNSLYRCLSVASRDPLIGKTSLLILVVITV